MTKQARGKQKVADLFDKVRELSTWSACVHSDRHMDSIILSCCQ